MKFAVKPAEKESSAPQVSAEDVIASYEGLLDAYMDMSEAQRNLDEVCQVMENIELSMKMLQSGSADAVKLLNVDKSLESLLSVAEEKMTVESATEGLTDALKTAWEKFKSICKTVWEKIKKFFAHLNYLCLKATMTLMEKIAKIKKGENPNNPNGATESMHGETPKYWKKDYVLALLKGLQQNWQVIDATAKAFGEISRLVDNTSKTTDVAQSKTLKVKQIAEHLYHNELRVLSGTADNLSSYFDVLEMNETSLGGYVFDIHLCKGSTPLDKLESTADDDLESWNKRIVEYMSEEIESYASAFKKSISAWDSLKQSLDIDKKIPEDIEDREVLYFFQMTQTTLKNLATIISKASVCGHSIINTLSGRFFVTAVAAMKKDE